MGRRMKVLTVWFVLMFPVVAVSSLSLAGYFLAKRSGMDQYLLRVCSATWAAVTLLIMSPAILVGCVIQRSFDRLEEVLREEGPHKVRGGKKNESVDEVHGPPTQKLRKSNQKVCLENLKSRSRMKPLHKKLPIWFLYAVPVCIVVQGRNACLFLRRAGVNESLVKAALCIFSTFGLVVVFAAILVAYTIHGRIRRLEELLREQAASEAAEAKKEGDSSDSS